MKGLLTVFVLIVGTLCLGKEIQISKGRETQYTIIQSNTPVKSEQFALKELTEHLGKITGAKFIVKSEKDADGIKAGIYLGWTDFARKAGLDFSLFGDEEWCIKTVGDNLIIGGGRRLGTLYGVYDFLETTLGCHWLAVDCTVFPSLPDLKINDIYVRKKPGLKIRFVYRSYEERRPTSDMTKNRWLFKARNRQNGSPISYVTGDYESIAPELRDSNQPLKLRAQIPNLGAPHNFHAYVPPFEYAKDHPEYYSMDENGKRVAPPAGQLCLTNHKVWEIALASLRKFIAADRNELPQKDWPKVYGILQMDSCGYICKCPNCTVVSKAEGGESALVINFVNFLADGIVKEYPDIMLRTFAYVSTDIPPKTARPRPNVIIWFCDLYGKSDCYRPITHKLNQPQFDLIKGWAAISDNVMLWDYGIIELKKSVPEVMIDALIKDYKTFADLKILGVCLEFAEGLNQGHGSFMDLQYYVALQMMLDPGQSPDILINRFMKNYYRQAEPEMSRYLESLRATIRDYPELMACTPPYKRGFVSAEFLLKCRSFLDSALAKLTDRPDDNEVRCRVYRECVTVNKSMLDHFNQFGEKFKSAGITKEKLLNEYRNYREVLIKAWSLPAAQEDLEKEFKVMSTVFEAPMPKEFSHIPASQIISINRSLFNPSTHQADIVDDPDSPAGKAMRFYKDDQELFKKPAVFGLYGKLSKTWGPKISIDKVPSDEKYHWYKIDPFSYQPGTILYSHTWGMCIELDQIFAGSADGMKDDPNLWETNISVKLTGPAYVPGSAKPNGIYLDRLVLTKPKACSEEPPSGLLTIKLDDGKAESHWGAFSSSEQIVCKILPLEIDPKSIKSASIVYEMGGHPYKKDKDGKYPDMEIRVNGKIVSENAPGELISKGWHKLKITPDILKKGDNQITFSIKPGQDGMGTFYLGIDNDSNFQKSSSSNDSGKTFKLETLRPGVAPNPLWQGEYMVRLELTE